MSARSVRRILNSLSLLCLGGAALIALWSVGELEDPETGPLRVPPVAAAEKPSVEEVTPEQLASVWSRQLQGRPKKVVRPDPVTPKVVPRPAVVDPRVELLATVIDGGRTVAILADARGRTDFKGVGETLDLIPVGLRVESIRQDVVMLSLRGRPIRVAMRGAAAGGSNVSGAREEDLLEPPGMRDQ